MNPNENTTEQLYEEYDSIVPNQVLNLTNDSKEIKTVVIKGSIGAGAKITASGCILIIEGSIESNVSIEFKPYKQFEIRPDAGDGKIRVDGDIGDFVTISNAWELEAAGNIGKYTNIDARSNISAFNVGDHSKLTSNIGYIYVANAGRYVSLNTNGQVTCENVDEYAQVQCAYYSDTYFSAKSVARCASIHCLKGDLYAEKAHASAWLKSDTGHTYVTELVGQKSLMDYVPELDSLSVVGFFKRANLFGTVTPVKETAVAKSLEVPVTAENTTGLKLSN